MIDEPIDFSPLDPRREPERFEQLVRSITLAAAAALGAPAMRRRGVMEQIAAWRTPMLAAAAVVTVASVLALVQSAAAAPPRTPFIAEAVGVPTTVAQWMRSSELPSAGDLLEAFGEQQ